MSKHVCKNCGTEFNRPPSRQNRSKEFCTLECKKEANPKTEVICKYCKEIFRVHKSRFKRGVSFCSKECRKQGWRGFKRSEEFKEKIAIAMKGRKGWSAGKKLPHRSGANCHFWKGGVSKKNRTERQNFCSTLEYREFRNRIFKRDNYTCQDCGRRTKKGDKVYIQLHHIKPFSKYPNLRTSEDNVVTLCRKCHYQTDTFGAKVYNYKDK